MTEARDSHHGRLKVYLSYAAGAGKTYRMLEEAQHLRQQGVDVVIGYFEPHMRKDTIGKTEGLEIVPRRKVEYRGTSFEDMDTEAILLRSPAVCLVDEFAHSNVPGSARNKRWEDVLALIDAGIEVWTTMNLQHLESLNDQVLQISGIRVRETVPDWVIKQASEVVMVDVTPEALINRLKRGAVYEPAKADRALANFFKEQTLVALREMALRQAAHEVETRHPEVPVPTRSGDRILIHVTSDPATAMLIRRGHRVSDYLQAECFAVYVCPVAELTSLSAGEREAVERHLNFARNLRIETRILNDEHVAERLVDFAHDQRVTQIFLAHPRSTPIAPRLRRDLVSRVLQLAQDMQIIVVAERRTPGTPLSGSDSRARSFVIGVVGRKVDSIRPLASFFHNKKREKRSRQTRDKRYNAPEGTGTVLCAHSGKTDVGQNPDCGDTGIPHRLRPGVNEILSIERGRYQRYRGGGQGSLHDFVHDLNRPFATGFRGSAQHGALRVRQ